jgi:o-succinylbenzoate---CoA ligase
MGRLTKLVDWLSEETTILTNPKIPEIQIREILKQLTDFDLKGHFWLATSGSTSTSKVSTKWVALSKEAILKSAEAVNRHLDVQSNDRWIHTLPHFHVGGLGILARAYLSGSKIFECQGKWNPQGFHQFCHEHEGTLTALVPTQLYDLVKKQLVAPYSIRATIIGGGALCNELYVKAKELGWNPLPSYGLSECASQVATASLDSLENEGFPKLELLSHIQDAKTTSEGCLTIQSPSLLTTYAIMTDNKAVLKDPKKDGWFITEDLVTIEDSTLTPQGRKSDIVKVGGENVNIEQLNQLLIRLSIEHRIEGDQVIIAQPSERLEHEVHLVEANTPENQLKTLMNLYEKRVLPFERIRGVHHLKEIPRTPLNKVKMGLIRELYTS